MTAKEPELRDFGVTPEEYALYKGEGHLLSPERGDLVPFIITLVVALVVFAITRNSTTAFLWGAGSFFPGLLVTLLVEPVIVRLKRARLLRSPVAPMIKLYEEATTTYQVIQEEAERQQREAEKARQEAERTRRASERARQKAERARRRKLIDHWMSLGGPELENEMATLCTHLGYQVESTPVSGDGGVDLVLRDKRGKKVVVQCKSYKSPVGPSAARELYGSMMDFGAEKAVLVCPAGFTRGVEQFVKGKPIYLVSASDLISLAASAEANKNGGRNGTGQ